MRISLVSLIAAGCAAALLFQVNASEVATTGAAAAPRGTAPRIPLPLAAARTTTLALEPLDAVPRARSASLGLTARTTPGYSMLGVSWDDPEAALKGTVRVRTRDTEHGRWSDWRVLAADSEDRADPRSAQQGGRHQRGATAPLWVGPSDGVEIRLNAFGTLPDGLRVELVDPGDVPPVTPPPAPPVLRPQAPADHQAPRPGIVSRSGWGADESLREPGFVYTGDVKAVFVHHTDTGNDYTCADAPKVVRGIYQYHVKTNGWRDIGYNFLVDRCGTIYEGRAGGVSRPVLGAHTLGFNTDSTGVAALGSYVSDAPPQEQVEGIAKISAWKLGLTSKDARGTVSLVSGSSGSRFPAGASHAFNTVSGHRDAFDTECPGDTLFARLDDIRSLAARLQGR